MNDKKPESSREWYRRTTRRSIRAIVFATIFASVFAFVGFFLIPRDVTLHLQVFNGAWTIPAFGGIWLCAFILIWLLPMRELGFRSQECMERMEAQVTDFVRDASQTLRKVEDAALKVSSKAEKADIERMTQALERVALRLEGDAPRLDLLKEAEEQEKERDHVA